MRMKLHSSMLHAETRKRALSLALTSAPVLGGVLLAIWLLKRRRRGNVQGKVDQEPGGAASGDDLEDKVGGDEVDDPWPNKGSKGKQAELPEAFPTLLLDEELPVSPRDLWRLVMADAQFFRRTQHAMRSSDLRLGRWQLGEDDKAVRRVRYVKPIKRQLIGPDRALCVERHESSGPPDAGFVVDVRVKTPEVPYGGNFYCHLQWAAAPAGKGHTRLRVSCKVVILKDFAAKSIVVRASIEGMKKQYKQYREHLLGQLGVGPSDGGAATSAAPTAGPGGMRTFGHFAPLEAGEQKMGRRLASWRIGILAALLVAAILGAIICYLVWLAVHQGAPLAQLPDLAHQQLRAGVAAGLAVIHSAAATGQATVRDAAWVLRRRAAAALLGSSRRLYWRGESTMLPAPL